MGRLQIHHTARGALGLLLCLALSPRRLGGDDWPQWRGPRRDGVSAETGLLKSWPPSGPPLLWTAENAGEGYSSVAVAGGRVFTMGNRGDDREFIIAYDAGTGAELWAVAHAKGFRNGRGNGPRGTPTVAGTWLYAEGATGQLTCLETRSGERRWSFNILERFRVRNLQWGLSESPLVAGKFLIVTPGARDASVVALDRENGDVLWRCPGDRAGYASPILIEVEGVEQVVVFHSSAVVGIRLDDGEPLWEYARASNRTANVATPVFHDGHVFVTSDYGTGCALLRIVPREGATFEAREVYFNREMKNHHGGVILAGGHIYGFSSRILTCMEFPTGRTLWRHRGVGKGSLVHADGHLYCLSEDGVVGLVKATPEGYREVGRFDLGRDRWPTWTHPVVAGGRLFLRRDDRIFCFDLRAAPARGSAAAADR